VFCDKGARNSPTHLERRNNMTVKEKILANKIKSLNARWHREMAEHERQYEHRFNAATTAEEILALNKWSRERIAEIRRRWSDGVLNA
jgi:hypothetical protein